MPKKYALAKKKKEKEEEKARKEAEAEAAAARGEEPKKSPKKKKVDKSAFPDLPEAPRPADLNPSEAMGKTVSWNHSNVIDNKFSTGTLTTATYQEKVGVFMKMNEMAETKASVFPPANYIGPSSTAGTEDPYNRRVVRKLNDIDFDEDSDPEEIKNLKRMPKTIMNGENLREILGSETLGLNLENHYWLKSDILSKIGKMAPNLIFLSLRRMKFISNPIFAEIFHHLHHLKKVDLSDCDGLLASATNLLVTQN